MLLYNLLLFWLFSIVSCDIDEDWIFESATSDTSYKIPDMSAPERKRCEDECMKKFKSDQCSTVKDCGCLFEDFQTVSDVVSHYQPCLESSTWWKTFQKRKELFRTKCGIAIDSFGPTIPNSQRFKISVGPDAKRLQFPWAIRTSEPYQPTASAVLIGKTTVLTAKHVVTNPATGVVSYNMIFTGGDVDHRNNNIEKRTAKPKNIIIHPDFEVDLAIVELDKEIENTAPVCLPPRDQVLPPPDVLGHDELPGYPYRTAGWGKTATEERATKLRFVDLKWHWDAWNKVSHEGLLDYFCSSDADANNICSKEGYFGTYNICPGDSGTGWYFLKKDSDNIFRWYLMGTVKMGKRRSPCTATSVSPYGVWVKIPKQLDWICSNTGIGC